MPSLDQREYERLLNFRTGLRRFLKWSAAQAAAAGLTPARHQLLLAIRSHPDPAGPTVGDVARSLTIRHHSTVELVDRVVAAGLVERRQDSDDSLLVGAVIGAIISGWAADAPSRRWTKVISGVVTVALVLLGGFFAFPSWQPPWRWRRWPTGPSPSWCPTSS
jgi:MarR family